MFSDPYEEWKQGGRRGPAPGSQPAAPAPLTTPPAPAPPAPAGGAPRPPAPAPAPAPAQGAKGPGGQDLSGFKTYSDWQAASGGSSAEVQNWYNQKLGVQGAAPNPTAAGQNLEERFRTQRTGGNEAQPNDQWRDPAYSQAQWGAWEQEERDKAAAGTSAQNTVNKYNPDGKGCPPNMPFTSRPGPDGKSECAYKPDDCPDGSHVVGTPGRCVPGTGGGGEAGGGGGGGVGGGAGGGGGSSSSFSASSTPGGGDMQEWWKNKIMQQPDSRYTPEAMAALEADQFSRARAQEKLQLQQSRQDQAQRGVSRSANQNAAVRQIGVGTGQQIMANRADIQKRKIDADFQDRQAAIKNAQDYVNSMRDYLLRGEGNAIQREQISAQIRLANMNIRAQKEQLEQSYQNDLSRDFLGGGR